MITQQVPLNVHQPWVVFYFLRPIISQTFHWLPLYKLIYEICCFIAPSWRHFVRAYLNLSGQNIVPDLLSPPAIIRPPAKHALISYDAYSIVINAHTMILLAHHFWSHIPRGARSLVFVILGPYSCNAEICYFEISLRIKN